jgi:phage FluMu protein Com
MEIIKRGRISIEKSYTIKCRWCETVFMFKESEGKFVSDFRDGDYLEIKCPVCSQQSNVSTRLGVLPPLEHSPEDR